MLFMMKNFIFVVAYLDCYRSGLFIAFLFICYLKFDVLY